MKKRKKYNTVIFREEAFKVHGNKNNYDKAVYQGWRTKLCITCLVDTSHGDYWQTPANHIWHKNGCKKCSHINAGYRYRFTTEQYKEKVIAIYGNRFDLSETIYTGYENKLKVRCIEHNEIFYPPARCLLDEQVGCRHCAKRTREQARRQTCHQFKTKARKIHGDDCDYSRVKYINDKTKLEIGCNLDDSHGYFWMKPNSHISGKQGCPLCYSSSIGERLIFKILKRNNIEFKTQYKIPEATYNFRYDFYIEEYRLIIEFHGIQHYKPVKHFGGLERYNHLVERDTFKYELAKLARYNIIYFNYKHLKLNVDKFEQMILCVINRFKKRKFMKNQQQYMEAINV